MYNHAWFDFGHTGSGIGVSINDAAAFPTHSYAAEESSTAFVFRGSQVIVAVGD